MTDASTKRFPPGGAIVFGASGAIGARAAELLAREGAGVALTCHANAAAVEELRERIAGQGGDAFCAQCDILDREAVERVTAQAVDRFGALHSVILATGRVFANLPMAEMDIAEFEQQIRTDTTGFLHVVKATVPHLRATGAGSITVVMGVTLERIFPNNSMAAVPKLAQAGMIRFLAREEAANGIRVNGVAPGVVDEGMSRKLLARNSDVTFNASQATPLGREGTATEIAEAAVFLAGAGSGFTTGQILVIDGGLTL